MKHPPGHFPSKLERLSWEIGPGPSGRVFASLAWNETAVHLNGMQIEPSKHTRYAWMYTWMYSMVTMLYDVDIWKIWKIWKISTYINLEQKCGPSNSRSLGIASQQVEDFPINKRNAGRRAERCRGLAAAQPALHNFQTFVVLDCRGMSRECQGNRSEEVWTTLCRDLGIEGS